MKAASQPIHTGPQFIPAASVQLKTNGQAAIPDNRPQAFIQRQQVEMIQRKCKECESEKTELMPKPVFQRRENKTGLPDQLKSGIENLSGIGMDDVKVHYNSSKPAQLNALAYAQGSDIHVASGQEKHLPHEAWHVVQQKQGRVKPTIQMKTGTPVNDDPGLEKEADRMGARAMQLKMAPGMPVRSLQLSLPAGTTAQRVPCNATDHPTSAQHRAVQADFNLNVAAAAAEYEIPEGSLLQNPDGSHRTGYADLVTGANAIYDIKRHDEGPPIAQLDRYVDRANHHCGGGFAKGGGMFNRNIPYNDQNTISYWRDLQPGVISYRMMPRPQAGQKLLSSFFAPKPDGGGGGGAPPPPPPPAPPSGGFGKGDIRHYFAPVAMAM